MSQISIKIILILLNLSLIVALPLPDENFALIYDAGSKNTRLNIYSYEFSNQNILMKQLEYFEMKDGGLSTYITENDVEEKFKESIAVADSYVPAEKRAETKIFLGATAGMRLLEIKDKARSDSILNWVRQYLRKSGYSFTDDSQVGIVSGRNEGIFAWLSSNYLKILMNKNDFYGIVELGGSSGQITFLPYTLVTIDTVKNKYVSDLRINGKSLQIYSHSFLCWGTTQVANLYNAFNIKRENYASSFKTSCYPDGGTEEVTGQELLEMPCVNGLMYKNTSFAIDTSKIKSSDVIQLKGNSKRNKCREEVDALFPTTECTLDNNECSFDGVYQPSFGISNFLALGNFYESIDNSEKLLNKKLQNDLGAFDNATYTICQLTYSELKALEKANKADISNKKLRKLCLENVYILKLLKLYGFKSLERVNAVETINENKVNWAQGYLLNELGLFSETHRFNQ